MTRNHKRAQVFLFKAALVAAVIAFATVGCTGEDAELVPGAQNTPSSEPVGGPRAGDLGGRCNVDRDCVTGGARCLTPALSGTGKYCASPCSTLDDCGSFAATSYILEVPTTSLPQGGDPKPTIWGTKYLTRGVGCAPTVAAGPKFCQFVCPDKAAVVVDENGAPTGCSCLPGFQINGEKSACEPDPSIECSILSYSTGAQRDELRTKYGIEVKAVTCDACNSNMDVADQLGCHTGRFMCELRNNALEGRCAEVLSASELNSCIMSKTQYSCDCQCPSVDACGFGANSKSFDCACCDCKQIGEITPRPVCNGTPTEPGGGRPDAGSGDAGGKSDGGDAGGTSDGGDAGGKSDGGKDAGPG